MKAALFTKKERIEVCDLERPTVGPDEVLVDVKASGVCGTDVHIFNGEEGSTKVVAPVILGHEFSGVVSEVGSEVSTVKVGDHITIDPNRYCGKCFYCKNGNKQMCDNLEATGVNENGGFAEYSVVKEKQCIKIKKEIPFTHAALSEPLACCIHGLENIDIQYGDNVCIIGAGAIGLLMVQLVKLRGASTVIVSEPVDMRRSVSLECGADYTIDPINQDLYVEIDKIVGSRGVDVVIECVGSEKACSQAVKIANKGGKILLFGVPSPKAELTINLIDVFKKELTLKGSFINPDTQEKAVAIINSEVLNLESIITHCYEIDKVEEAICKQMENDSLKVMIVQ